ncbi:MAG: hypothetical protein WBA38_11910 [Gordonia sp. (in: high G+C Gram-positive bacteria)]|uniref:hypothetical protein n=1 Tax=Gordonia sp. (in: high G+C Gram-positive bacteria) TaxID=84139 RepID=UPI003C70D7AC
MPNPTPTVWVQVRQPGGPINTTNVGCSTVLDAEGRECLPHRRASILGELTVDWGRSDVWAQPDPAVFTMTVWQSDAAAQEWPDFDLAHATPGSGMVSLNTSIGLLDAHGNTYYVFQGRMTNVDAERQQVRTERGLENGWLLRIQASDRAGGLAQVDKQGFVKLDAGRTMKANADFLNVFSGWANIRETYFEAQYQNGKCRYVDMVDKTLYDVLVELYASFSHQFCYNSRRNTLNRIPAAYNHGAYSLALGRTAVGGTVRLYAPRWVDNTGREDPQDSQSYASGYIGGNQVSGDVRISADQGQAISHIECKWHDASRTDDDVVSRVLVTSSANRGLLRFDSWFSDGLQIDPIMQDVKRKCLAEGSRAFHPTVTWDTRVAGEVPDWNTFEALTLPAQTVAMVVVTGSPYASFMASPPVWYPAGGVIAYSGGYWRFTTNLAPAPLVLSGTPITFADLAASSTGSTLTMGQLDGSISSYDMRYVTNPTLENWE